MGAGDDLLRRMQLRYVVLLPIYRSRDHIRFLWMRSSCPLSTHDGTAVILCDVIHANFITIMR